MDIRVFNNLPSYITDIFHNPRKFKVSLKHFLYTYYFYSIDKDLHSKATQINDRPKL
jgi:hypothetical protein